MAEVGAEKGYVATTVTDVVARAGISRATFYELFDGKEQCYVAAMDTLLAEVLVAARRGYAETDDWAGSITAGLAATLALLASRPALAHLILVEHGGAGPAAGEAYLAGKRTLVRALEGAYAAADPPVEVPSLASRAAVAATEALVVDHIVAGRTEHLPGLLADLLYVTLLPALGQAEALRVAREAAAVPSA